MNNCSNVLKPAFPINYIVHTRFKQKAICGEVNFPYGSLCIATNNLITYKGSPICYITSQNAYDYFANNDDGQGLKRGELTQSITKLLAKRDKFYQARWDKIWADKTLTKFKRPENADYWLWNFEFYNASIEDLEYIYNLIK